MKKEDPMDKIYLEVKRFQLSDLYKAVNYMYYKNFDSMDYLIFFNVGTLLEKIHKTEYQSNFSGRENYKITLSPNEAHDLIKLFTISENLTLTADYFENLLNGITAQIHKQFTELIHKKNIYSLNNLTENKTNLIDEK